MSGSSKNLLSPGLASPADLRPLPKGQQDGGLSVRQQPTGSATGNPRNKVALRPGFSLMDWIRLTKSGQDLAGTRGRMLSVTPSELRKHNKKSDAWMALNGKVYNVTSYMEYHPGGWDELMRGAGKDATKLFNETHQWVNYESMLSACLVGKLVGDKPKLVTPPQPVLPPPPVTSQPEPGPPHMVRPSHDFHQTDESVVVSVYTKRRDPVFAKAFGKENVVVDVQQRPDKEGSESTWLHILVFMPYAQEADDAFRFYQVCYKLFAGVAVDEKPAVRTASAAGKVEVRLKKAEVGRRWPNLGWAVPGNDMHGDSAGLKEKLLSFPAYRKWTLASKVKLNHDTSLYTFEPPYKSLAFEVPVGHHVILKADVENDVIIERPYTPVTSSLEPKLDQQRDTKMHFAIKTYPDGSLTPFIDKLEIGSTLDISNPTGGFRTSLIDGASDLTLLAAGTGITPMVKLIQRVFQTATSPVNIRLIFFNKTEADIVWKSELDSLSKLSSSGFKVHHVLSQEQREGYDHGRVSTELLSKLIPSPIISKEGKHSCVCGPIPFNVLAEDTLKSIGYKDSEIFVFQG